MKISQPAGISGVGGSYPSALNDLAAAANASQDGACARVGAWAVARASVCRALCQALRGGVAGACVCRCLASPPPH
jgi:hypothetical protein